VKKGGSAAGVGLELIARQKTPSGPRVEIWMRIFQAWYVRQLKRLAHGHDADIATIRATLQADFDYAIKIFLYHAVSPV
jgi:hypothetical protein